LKHKEYKKQFKNMIATGIEGHLGEIVSEELCADRIGSGLVKVFATPMMIALIEQTCNESVMPFLEAGQGTVGTRIDVSHCAATPVGMRVWCDSVLTEVDRRRLVFNVKAYDECGLIGEGTHERFVIDSERFQQKTDDKAKLLAGREGRGV
jgi:predicted thioesterase